MNSDSISGPSTRPVTAEGRAARRRARVRERLLDAARTVFAARGFHDATIAEITRLADVSVGAFYLHFRDKEQAFQIVLRDGYQQLRDAVVDSLRDAEQPTLPLVIRSVLRQAYTRRDLFRIALTGGAQPLRAFRPQQALVEGFERVLETPEARALLEPAYDRALLARQLTGLVAQSIAWWFEHEEPGPDGMADQVLALVAHGLPPALFTLGAASE